MFTFTVSNDFYFEQKMNFRIQNYFFDIPNPISPVDQIGRPPTFNAGFHYPILIFRPDFGGFLYQEFINKHKNAIFRKTFLNFQKMPFFIFQNCSHFSVNKSRDKRNLRISKSSRNVSVKYKYNLKPV